MTVGSPLRTSALPSHRRRSKPRAPPCSEFAPLLQVTWNSLPSIVNLPLAMRFAQRPAVQPKYCVRSTYACSDGRPSTTSTIVPFQSGTQSSVMMVP